MLPYLLKIDRAPCGLNPQGALSIFNKYGSMGFQEIWLEGMMWHARDTATNGKFYGHYTALIGQKV